MLADALTAESVHLAVGTVFVAIAVGAVYLTDRPNGGWTRALRSRFILGVPWGTLVTIAAVVAVYLFVQSGLENPDRPVVIPFRSWSYFYAEGVLWSGFAHSGRSHITGNLLSTLVAGAIAEYAYGHYPGGRSVDRDEHRRAFTVDRVPSLAALRAIPRQIQTVITAEPPSTNPYIRAFVIVPSAMVAFGFLSSLFALGPVIGFSGVVFALWGFALVHYPVGTIAALTGATLVNVVYDTLRNPVVFAEASGSFGAPSWANIAVQGHAIGVISGILAAVWLIRRRRRLRGEIHETTSETAALVTFGAVLLFGASRRLWAVYWYLGNEQYELYRAVGVGLVALLAAIVAVAVAGRDAPIWPDRAVPDPTTLREAVGSATPAAVGLLLLVATLAVVAGPGIVPNLVTVDDGDLPGEPIEVEGYQVTYAEDVEDQLVSVIDIEAFGRSTSVNTSGVIVKNADREIWTTTVSQGNLAFWGYRAVDVGGTGWRETVWVQRTGWVAANGDPTYRVDGIYNETRSTLFTSDPARTEPRVDGRNITVAAVDGGFKLRVDHENTTETALFPSEDDPVTIQGVTFNRVGDRILAERGETRVQIARQERYDGRR